MGLQQQPPQQQLYDGALALEQRLRSELAEREAWLRERTAAHADKVRELRSELVEREAQLRRRAEATCRNDLRGCAASGLDHIEGAFFAPPRDIL